jgi:hypothetical protein
MAYPIRRFTSAMAVASALGGCASKGKDTQVQSGQENQMGLLDRFHKRGANRAGRPQARQFSIVIAGYGVEASPRLPAGVAHLENGTLIFGPLSASEAPAQGGLKNVLLKPGQAPAGPLEKRLVPGSPIVTYSSGQQGTTFLALGEGMDGFGSVLERFRTADSSAQWTIISDDHEIRWPARFTLRANGDVSPRSWPYELGLDGSVENLIYLQGPLTGAKQTPAPEQLVAPGMETVGQGDLKGTVSSVIWFELAYEHGGAQWRQRVYYVPIDSESVYLLRAQGTSEVASRMFKAADLVATSFRPR